jgi:Tfp pilus assembly protein PilZ
MDLCSLRSETGGRKALQMVRATTRYQLQTKVTLKIFPDNHMGTPLVLNGYTEDISLGGTCVRLGEKYWSGSSTDMVGKTVKLLINVPKASAGLDVIGTVVWRREVTYDERKTVLVGIQFNEMEEDDFDFLKRHCYIGEGEQDMIFSLWESFVKK